MDKPALFFRICTAVVAIGMLAGAAMLWPAEFASTQLKNRSAVDWYTDPTVEDVALSPSMEAYYSMILGCDRALSDPVSRLMPGEARTRVTDLCLDRMDAILATAPSLAGAHLIRGLALTLKGETAAARDAFATSERWGRGLNWMAARRVNAALALGLSADVPPEGDWVQRDMTRLLKRGQNPAIYVAIHTAYPAQQDALLTRIEMLPVETQRRFLRAMQQRG